MMDTVHIQQGDYHLHLCLPQLHILPLKNINKIFRIALHPGWASENEEAIHTVGQFLEDRVAESKEAWAKASKEYQDGWRLIEKPARRRTRKEIEAAAAVKAHNEELTSAVKRSKALHDKWVKIQELWIDTKRQMKL